MNTILPEHRARAIRYYFGWDGATIHQLADATGLPAEDILYKEYDSAAAGDGFSAVRTCGREWRVTTLAPRFRGNFNYWMGVVNGFWATGPLDRKEKA